MSIKGSFLLTISKILTYFFVWDLISTGSDFKDPHKLVQYWHWNRDGGMPWRGQHARCVYHLPQYQPVRTHRTHQRHQQSRTNINGIHNWIRRAFTVTESNDNDQSKMKSTSKIERWSTLTTAHGKNKSYDVHRIHWPVWLKRFAILYCRMTIAFEDIWSSCATIGHDVLTMSHLCAFTMAKITCWSMFHLVLCTGKEKGYTTVTSHDGRWQVAPKHENQDLQWKNHTLWSLRVSISNITKEYCKCTRPLAAYDVIIAHKNGLEWRVKTIGLLILALTLSHIWITTEIFIDGTGHESLESLVIENAPASWHLNDTTKCNTIWRFESLSFSVFTVDIESSMPQVPHRLQYHGDNDVTDWNGG